jgi:hypothetical protein
MPTLCIGKIMDLAMSLPNALAKHTHPISSLLAKFHLEEKLKN